MERSPMETAARMLSRQPLGKLELAQKLKAKKFTASEVADAVRECERLGYLDDSAVAALTVTSMRDRGDGAKKIRLKLNRKGIAAELTDSAFQKDSAEFERDDRSVALELLRRKKNTLMHEADPQKRKLKALRALASKGFSSGTAYSAVSQFFNPRSDD